MDDTQSTDRSIARIVSRRTLHETRKFSFEQMTVSRGDATYYVAGVRHPGAAVVLPLLDTAEGRVVVMIRNYRPMLGEQGRVIWELPAGTIEKGEPVEVAAHRELVEETGYRAQSLVPLARFFTTPGMTDEVMWSFVARGLEHVGARPEADEQLTVEHVPVSGALAMIENGELADGKSILSLLLAAKKGLL